jgi:PAS domain S-box-containing protein
MPTDVPEKAALRQRVRELETRLGERVKELSCFHRLGELVERAGDLAEILAGVPQLIPPSWLHPDCTEAELLLRGEEYRTPDFRETPWMQTATVQVHGRSVGSIRVALTEAKPAQDDGPFLREERELLDSLAERLGRVIERLEAQERLEHLNAVLRAARRVNEVAATEKNARRLLQSVCDTLVETRGYRAIWIASRGDEPVLQHLVHAGFGPDFEPLRRELESRCLPRCWAWADESTDVVVVEDPARDCAGCPLAGLQAGSGVFLKRLCHGAEEYGLLAASVNRHFVHDRQEQSLFAEIADEVALALHGLSQRHQREEAQDALSASEQRYRALFHSIRDAILVADTDRRILDCNAAFTRLFGYRKEEIQGEPTAVLYAAEEDFRGTGKALREKGRDGRFALTIQYRAKDGTVFPGRTDVDYLHDADGELVGFIGVIRDLTEHRRREARLAASERRAQRIVAASADGIVVVDQAGRIAFLNPAAEQLFDRSRKELLWHDFGLPFASDGPSEGQILRPDGTVRQIEMYTSDFEWEGEPATLALLRDVTAEEEARQKLLKLNRQLRLLSETNQRLVRAASEAEFLEEICRVAVIYGGYRMAWVGMKEEGPEKRVRPVAQSGFEDGYLERLRLTWADTERGRGPGGTSIREGRTVVCNDIHDAESFRPWRGDAAARGYNAAIALPLRLDDEVIGMLAIYAERTGAFTDDEVDLLQELAADLSYGIAMQRLEVARQEAESHWRSLVQNAPDIIFTVDREYRILFINHTPSQIDVEEVLGDDIRTYVDEAYRQTLAEAIDRVYATGRAESLETAGLGPGGRTSWYSTSIGPVSRNGEVTTVILTSRDITQRKRAEEEQRATTRQLQQAVRELEETQKQIVKQERLRALGEMASGVAHDFNNQLQMILGFAEMLGRQLPELKDAQKAERCVEQIRNAGVQAAGVVSRLREFYRPASDQEMRATVDLAKRVEKAIGLTEPKWSDEAQAAGRPVAITKDLQPVPEIRAEAGELEEVLLNLILNAVDAMPEGGTLSFRTWTEEGWAALSVSDSGVGMDAAAQERCLEPFFSTKGEKGTGLGLSVAHGIVQRHHGRMEIDSAPGEGTRFRLYFPPAGEADKPEAAAPDRQQRRTGCRILVVDDEAAIRLVISRHLLSLGHEPESVPGGKEALERLQEEEFDLLLTDRAMPGLDGDRLAREARALHPDLPVILLTGFGEMLSQQGEKPPTVDVILAKPVSSEDLSQAVQSVLA